MPDALAAEFLLYNRWANLVLIDACRAFAGEQLDSSMPNTYGSIYDTLRHIIRSEAGYYHTLTGVRLEPPFAWDSRPSLAALRPYAEQVSSALVAAAEQMRPADLVEQEWQGQTFRYKAVALLIQAVNHGVEHRTHITAIMAQLGIQPPDVDGWEYMKSNLDHMGA